VEEAKVPGGVGAGTGENGVRDIPGALAGVFVAAGTEKYDAGSNTESEVVV
jgi:hypothetical protein